MSTPPAIWAHRGASAVCPENTLPAFERAVDMGADGIELDIQRTADGRLVVCHDETVDRTSNGTGRIVDLDWDYLSRLDLSGGRDEFQGTRLPLLDEVFELMRPTGKLVNVELKDSREPYPGMHEQARALASRMGMSDHVIWSSFNHLSLRAIRESDAATPTGVLYEEVLADPWDYAARLGASAIHPGLESLRLTPGAVEQCRAAGVRVHVWTPNTDDEIREAAALGVDAVITDRPDVARTVLAAAEPGEARR